jgi:hypothetical protein
MDYFLTILGLIFGVYWLVGGLWCVGYDLLPGDGRMQLSQARGRIAGALSLCAGILFGYLGLVEGESTFETVFYVACAGPLIWAAIQSIWQGKFVLFDIYPRVRDEGRKIIIWSSAWLVIDLFRLGLLVLDSTGAA